MAAQIKSDQRIARLTPLPEVLAYIESRVKPVAPKQYSASAACGLVLAEDVRVSHPLPAHAIALRDGYAVDSELTRDATSYAPATLFAAHCVNAGETMPPDTDAILPQDAVTRLGATAATLSPATTGDGVLATGGDAGPGTVLFRSGRMLRNSDIAVLCAADVASVAVRTPRIAILRATSRSDNILEAAVTLLTRAVGAAGGQIASGDGDHFESALGRDEFDAAIAVGGTGTGQGDKAVTTLAQVGEVAFHGIAVAPGDTAGIGFVAHRPVLLIPGRLDAALTCWLLLGEALLNRLSGRLPEQSVRLARLTRKVASSLGLTELIPVTCKDEEVEPLASNYLPLQVIARADGWISVPAESEGYPAGSRVTVRPLP